MNADEKFAIIAGDIHKLIKAKKFEDIAKYPWYIPEDNDHYWVPIKDHKWEKDKGKWVWYAYEDIHCPRCKRHWYKRP